MYELRVEDMRRVTSDCILLAIGSELCCILLRLTHDSNTRHHQRVVLEDLVCDFVDRERLTVLAVYNAKDLPQYDHAFNRSAETEAPLRGVLEELESFSWVFMFGTCSCYGLNWQIIVTAH